MALLSVLKKSWLWFAGTPATFSLSERVFHFVCLVTCLALGYNIPLNYFVGLKLIAFITSIILVLVLCLYVLSRFLGKTILAITLFCSVGTVLFALLFFLNAGINGPIDLFFISLLIIIMVIAPARQYRFWLVVNIVEVLTLHLLQYTQPELIGNAYRDLSDRYIDITSGYFTVLAVVIVSFYYFKRNYEQEKKSSEQKAAVMKLLNEEKNKLFSIISHDLRAPLSNIQNYLELIASGDFSENEKLEINNQLLQSTHSTIAMLDNVLSWSKNQMLGGAAKIGPVNLYNVLSPQLLLFINMAGSKNITLQISVDQKLEVLGNGDMILLIARNLLTNAIKFTANGGRIIFSAKSMSNHCSILVKDSGNGTPVKLSNDIFYLNSEPAVGTSNEKGIGLGLVLCKEFTELQHGHIRFDCDPVSGTSFFVTLPLV